ncbi:hypothetical protein K4F52_006022 [Lecanicillium sp. MT-2017a]|nr:hypothetical protein K4F52_006022 [Lecanicillium sp. MT-2017a]
MSSIPKATKSNIEQLKAGVEWDILTRTFQETLLLAVKLGIKYVWIDSLCIIQDDDQDWKEQAAKMADTYENAELVISATNASDGSMGLFQERKPAQILASDNTPSSWTVREPGSTIQVIPLHGPECKDKDCPIYISRDTARHAQWDSMDGIATGSSQFNPLLGRGWAFQERLLATRIVHFADHELIWECKETQRCECMHLDRTDGRPILERSAENIKHRFSEAISRPPVSGNSPPPIDLFDLWASVVEKYTERMLTYEKDRLPALEGAIRKLQEKNLGTCVGGLFLSDLPRCLLWQVAQPGTRHPVYRAPTWSWASVMPAPNSSPRVEYLWHHRSEGLGTYEYMPEQTFIEELDGIVHATTLDTEEPQYGLHFRAPMILATLHINVAASPYHDFSRGSGFVTHGDVPQNHRYTVTFNGQTVTFMHDVAIHGKPNSPVPASPVSLVAVARRTNQAKPDQALVLRRLESTEDYAAIGMRPQKFTDPMYSRIGIITSLEGDTKGWFDDAEQKQLVLF